MAQTHRGIALLKKLLLQQVKFSASTAQRALRTDKDAFQGQSRNIPMHPRGHSCTCLGLPALFSLEIQRGFRSSSRPASKTYANCVNKHKVSSTRVQSEMFNNSHRKGWIVWPKLEQWYASSWFRMPYNRNISFRKPPGNVYERNKPHIKE